MDVSDSGEKIHQLVDEHILSNRIDLKIPTVDLLTANFKEPIKPNQKHLRSN